MTIMAGALVILASCSGNKNVENQTKVELMQTQISTVASRWAKWRKRNSAA